MPTLVEELDTPAVVVDLDRSRRTSPGRRRCPRARHEQSAAYQDAQDPGDRPNADGAGAVGITCQKLGEVEVFVDAGVADDILLTYNVLGEAKTERLIALIRRAQGHRRRARQRAVVRGLSEAGKRHGVDIRFLIECDTGFGATACRRPRRARARRRRSAAEHAVRGADDVPHREPDSGCGFERALELLDGAAIPVPVVSGGGSPALKAAGLPDADRASRGDLHLQRRHDGHVRHRHLGRLRHAGCARRW